MLNNKQLQTQRRWDRKSSWRRKTRRHWSGYGCKMKSHWIVQAPIKSTNLGDDLISSYYFSLSAAIRRSNIAADGKFTMTIYYGIMARRLIDGRSFKKVFEMRLKLFYHYKDWERITASMYTCTYMYLYVLVYI